MKKMIVYIVGFHFLLMSTHAQRPGDQLTPSKRAEHRVTMLEKEITFTKEVRAQMLTIIEEFISQATEYRKAQNHEKMREARDERDSRVKAVLSDTDYQKYQSQMRQARQDRRQGPGQPPPHQGGKGKKQSNN